MNITHSALIIAVSALTTMGIRFFPFLVFGKKRKVPELVQYLGRVLPCAIMASLVVYCLKGVTLFTGNHGLPELIAVAVVIGLIISILQATTQIHEQTLTFLPKLIGMAIIGIMTGSWMLHKLTAFTERIFDIISKITS